VRTRLVLSWIASVGLLGVLSLAAPASAQTLSNAEFHKLAPVAKTAADHQKLAAYYHAQAAEQEAQAKLHEGIAAAASKKRDDDSWETARAAAHYAEHAREAAEALTDLAKLHEGMAERAAGKK